MGSRDDQAAGQDVSHTVGPPLQAAWREILDSRADTGTSVRGIPVKHAKVLPRDGFTIASSFTLLDVQLGQTAVCVVLTYILTVVREVEDRSMNDPSRSQSFLSITLL